SAGSAAGGVTRPSYLCVADGFVGVSLWVGELSAGVATAGFIIQRTVDANGDPDGTGAHVLYGGVGATNPPFIQSARFAGGLVVYTASNSASCILVPHAESDVSIDGDTQAYQAWG